MYQQFLQVPFWPLQQKLYGASQMALMESRCLVPTLAMISPIFRVDARIHVVEILKKANMVDTGYIFIYRICVYRFEFLFNFPERESGILKAFLWRIRQQM